MALATTLSEVADACKELLEVQAENLGIVDGCVFYGDQERIPGYPAVCIEPDVKTSDLYGAGRMTEIDFRVYLLVYHGEVRNVQINKRDSDILAEAIVNLLNANATFGGTVIHCYVAEVQSGYAMKLNNTLRTTRITFILKSQERLPNNP